MYEVFQLNSSQFKLMGYHWKALDPTGVICLIHGIGEHAGRYDGMASYFQTRNFAFLSMDLRGHGCSPGIRGHAAPRTEILADIDALVGYAETSYPGKPIFIYGHSMGGNIALDYRARGNNNSHVKGFVISAPWLKLVKFPKWPVIQTVKLLSRVMPARQIKTKNNPGHMSRQPDQVKKYERDPLIHGMISVLTAMDANDCALRLLRTKVNGAAPLLLMHGTGDAICSIVGSNQLCELEEGSCTMIAWEDFFHEIHNEERGNEVIAAACDWMTKLA